MRLFFACSPAYGDWDMRKFLIFCGAATCAFLPLTAAAAATHLLGVDPGQNGLAGDPGMTSTADDQAKVDGDSADLWTVGLIPGWMVSFGLIGAVLRKSRGQTRLARD